jgi:hypothetical protein
MTEDYIEDTEALRLNILKSKSKDIFGQTGMHPNAVWGVIMDVTYDDGTITAISLVDGTADMYVSTGGGITGGSEDESIAGLSSTISSGGGTFFARYGKETNDLSPPSENNVQFFFLTDSKTLKTDQVNEDELADDNLPLSPLFQAFHVMISALQSE